MPRVPITSGSREWADSGEDTHKTQIGNTGMIPVKLIQIYRWLVLTALITILLTQDQVPNEQNTSIDEIKSQLKELTAAILAYHSDERFHLPPAALFDERSGKALLSWRVVLLPYLQQSDLYKQFRLNEPWDSEHNKKLLNRMPKVFTYPNSKSAQKGETHYRLFVAPAKTAKGKNDRFRPAFRWEPNQKLTYREIAEKDGTGNTLFIAEASDSVPWTKPDEILIEHDECILPQFGANAKSPYFVAVAANGDTFVILKRSEKVSVSPDRCDRLLRQMIGYSDGYFDDVTPILRKK